MSVSSPGQGPSPWLASIPAKDWPIDSFLCSGVINVPVALVPTNGGTIPMKNPKMIQMELRKATTHFQKITEVTEVRHFGRGGILCCSADQECVRELLNCSKFATQPVSPFIPAHLACSKGIVRGVNTSLTPAEILELFLVAGAVSVYRCARLVDNKKSPTESVIVTFAGTIRPSEIKAWPLIYKVEPLSPKPLQRLNCWRYGHSVKACRSTARCRLCGENHDSRKCNSTEEKCCLCHEAHPADSLDCEAKEQEAKLLEIVERRRCSRREAVTELQERSKGYASVTARHTTATDASLAKYIAEAIEKATEKSMERLASSIIGVVAEFLTSQLTQIIASVSMKNQTSQDLEVSKCAGTESSIAPTRCASPKAGPSNKTLRSDPEPVSDDTDEFTDINAESHNFLKRARSPLSKTSSQKSKSKKFLSKKDFLENLSK